MNNPPKITVLLPVYNRDDYLCQAIKIVLGQNFKDFELLIINDGSTDKSVEIVNSFKDNRIRLVNNEKNLGLIKTLNKGIELAKGKYIARMDSDDICLGNRLGNQYNFMEANPSITISGGWFRRINGKPGPVVKVATNPEEIKALLFFHTPIAHPTLIFNRENMLKHKLYYNESYKHAEDFELWVRASRLVNISNIKKVILHYRIHPSQITVASNKVQKENLNRCRKNQIAELGLTCSEAEFAIHEKLSNQRYDTSLEFLLQVQDWLLKINERNRIVQLFNPRVFESVLGNYWLGACYSVRRHDKKALSVFNQSK